MPSAAVRIVIDDPFVTGSRKWLRQGASSGTIHRWSWPFWYTTSPKAGIGFEEVFLTRGLEVGFHALVESRLGFGQHPVHSFELVAFPFERASNSGDEGGHLPIEEFLI